VAERRFDCAECGEQIGRKRTHVIIDRRAVYHAEHMPPAASGNIVFASLAAAQRLGVEREAPQPPPPAGTSAVDWHYSESGGVASLSFADEPEVTGAPARAFYRILELMEDRGEPPSTLRQVRVEHRRLRTELDDLTARLAEHSSLLSRRYEVRRLLGYES